MPQQGTAARANCTARLYCRRYRRKCKAIEFMVVDALLEADSALRISDKIRSAADFQLLDDNVLDVRWRTDHA